MLDQDVDFISILLDCSPKVVPFTSNVDKKLIQIPTVTCLTSRLAQLFSVGGWKFKTSLPDGFVADFHAPDSEKLFNFSISQRESVVEPYSVTDNGFWKTMAFVNCDLIIHYSILKGRALS
ncbi:MAG: hypothetical protein QNK24_09075 [Desulfuromusa sp.]|nr:hypothetical protein [Desulfuromusa sp.]